MFWDFKHFTFIFEFEVLTLLC